MSIVRHLRMDGTWTGYTTGLDLASGPDRSVDVSTFQGGVGPIPGLAEALDAWVDPGPPPRAVPPLTVEYADGTLAVGLPVVPPAPKPTVDYANILQALDPFAYVAGRAGVGKTTLAQAIAEDRDDTILCATTGIAAVNLGQASTLNSLLHYFDTTGLQKHRNSGYLTTRLEKLRRSGTRILLLDEVSMLAADQLTCLVEAVEEVNQTLGYNTALYGDDDASVDPRMKLLCVGDFCQLPPVEAPYAFESPYWDRFSGAHTITLTKVWRQENQRFADALQAVRLGKALEALEVLRGQFVTAIDPQFDGTTIVAKNAMVDLINARRHQQLPGEPLVWNTIRSGEQEKEWLKQIPEQVALKPGALVMCLMNRPIPSIDDTRHRDYFYVNGDLGTVIELATLPGGQPGTPPRPEGIKVRIHRTDEIVTVIPVTKEWTEPVSPPEPVAQNYVAKPGEKVQTLFDDQGRPRGKAITKRIKGAVTYMPLRLAWATTVHKSQGLSLDKVQIALGDWMYEKIGGMTYVALSRCRTLEGVRLVGTPQMFTRKCPVNAKVQRFL